MFSGRRVASKLFNIEGRTPMMKKFKKLLVLAAAVVALLVGVTVNSPTQSDTDAGGLWPYKASVTNPAGGLWPY